MGLRMSEIVQGEKWKKFMAKLYGWGAALVIVGALFKLQHWPFAGEMLTVGMSVEAIIFFFSAFEPIHEEVDWTLVYPELAGMHDDEYVTESSRKSGIDANDIKEIITGVLGELGASGGGMAIGGTDHSAIDPDAASKLQVSINNLSKTAGSLSDISKATVATEGYIKNLNHASDHLADFADNHKNTTDVLNMSFGNLAESYEKAATNVNNASDMFLNNIEGAGKQFKDEIVAAGNRVSEGVVGAAEGVTYSISELGKEFESNKGIVEQVSGDIKTNMVELNKNLSALNAVHQMATQEYNTLLEESKAVVGELHDASGKTQQFNIQLDQLNSSLSSLNDVYGNMLSSVEYIK